MKTLLAALLTTSDDAAQLIHDALQQHQTTGYIIAGLAACLFLAPIVLKALGKEVPFLDPVLEIGLKVLKSFSKAPPAPTPEEVAAKAKEQAAQPGVEAVTNVVDIKSLEKKP